MQDIPLRILIKIVLIAQFYFIIYQIIGNILRIKLCPNIICKFGIIYLVLEPGDRDHILSGVFNQFLSANPRASRINKRDNPKFCVTAKSGANREKFIMGGRREKRLPPC